MPFIDYFVDRATFNWEAELFAAIEDRNAAVGMATTRSRSILTMG